MNITEEKSGVDEVFAQTQERLDDSCSLQLFHSAGWYDNGNNNITSTYQQSTIGADSRAGNRISGNETRNSRET
jgi:hypothetical protein